LAQLSTILPVAASQPESLNTSRTDAIVRGT
jgi:hypothetical protein